MDRETAALITKSPSLASLSALELKQGHFGCSKLTRKEVKETRDNGGREGGNKRREKGVLAALAGWLVLPLSFFYPFSPFAFNIAPWFVCLWHVCCKRFMFSFQRKKKRFMFWDKTRVRHKSSMFEFFGKIIRDFILK